MLLSFLRYYKNGSSLNQLHLLNKYQINLVSHFSMESEMSISVPYQIDVKWYGFGYRFFFICYWFYFYQQIMKTDILFFTHFQKIILKYLVALPFNLTFGLKFSCSTWDECNLVYNKISNNCILINQQ